MILVDTDVMVDLLRQQSEALAWLKDLKDDEIVLPGYVVMELIQGCRNKSEKKELEKLKDFAVVWPASEVCDEALSVFSEFYLGYGIGIIDALIGQMAVSMGLPLYTHNRKHYSIIPGLKVVQPYRK